MQGIEVGDYARRNEPDYDQWWIIDFVGDEIVYAKEIGGYRRTTVVVVKANGELLIGGKPAARYTAFEAKLIMASEGLPPDYE